MRIAQVNELMISALSAGDLRYQMRGVLQRVRNAEKVIGYIDYQNKSNWNGVVFEDKFDFQSFHLIDSDVYQTAKNGIGYDGILSKRSLVIAAKKQGYVDAVLNELQKSWAKIDLISLELDALTVWERYFLMPSPHPRDWVAVAINYSVVARVITDYCGVDCFDSDAYKVCENQTQQNGYGNPKQ